MAKVGRIFMASVAGAVFPAMCFEILIGGLSSSRGSGYLPIILLVTFFHTIVFGLPGFLLLLKCGRVRAWTMTLVGFCSGMSLWLLLGLNGDFSGLANRGPVHMLAYALPGVLGAVGGLAFWSVWDFFSTDRCVTESSN